MDAREVSDSLLDMPGFCAEASNGSRDGGDWYCMR